MANKWYNKLVPKFRSRNDDISSYLRQLITGSLYRISDMRGNTGVADIQTQIDTMRALARDSQISATLSYYATDATTTNTAGQIIWATAKSEKDKEVADIINDLFTRWNVNAYARDHILELATVGNLYMPTSYLYKDDARSYSNVGVVLDNNTIPEPEFDIVPSTKIPPESIIHLWRRGEPCGYIMDPTTDMQTDDKLILPESACIHFSLGGLLGDYKIHGKDANGDITEYDIQFATPLLAQAVQPTQVLSLLEDASILSSLIRTIKFVNVRCGTNEEEIISSLQQIKDAIEQQISLNTSSGDIQSFVNPNSPNNLIYLPFVNDQEAISITDLNMAETSDADNKLLEYYQNKKLSVLGVPKEALNYSSAEGLGGAGQVMSQRSALYANCLMRLETAYMAGWKDGLNKYFCARGMSSFVDTFELHMQPIITTQSTIQFEKRDAAVGQAQALVDLLKGLGIENTDPYLDALTEILTEVFPQTGSKVMEWDVDVSEANMDEMGGGPNAF